MSTSTRILATHLDHDLRRFDKFEKEASRSPVMPVPRNDRISENESW